ncbi:MAG: hypothetical protein M3N98_03710 [Actinomycetota bacterium]|nr:hypothetical protein [Actinomycetota bacterium]
MKLATKLATAAGAVVLAGSGAWAALGSTPAAAHVPAVVKLSTPTPAPAGPDATAETPGTEAPDPANEPAGGHADAPGTTVDHQFDGVE